MNTLTELLLVANLVALRRSRERFKFVSQPSVGRCVDQANITRTLANKAKQGYRELRLRRIPSMAMPSAMPTPMPIPMLPHIAPNATPNPMPIAIDVAMGAPFAERPDQAAPDPTSPYYSCDIGRRRRRSRTIEPPCVQASAVAECLRKTSPLRQRRWAHSKFQFHQQDRSRGRAQRQLAR
jgi:hypothetical protein